MKSLFLFLVFLFLISTNAFCKWENRFYSDGANSVEVLNKKILVARMNGLSEYNLNNDEVHQYTMINSGLPANRVNSLLKLNEKQILLATRKGLAIWENGQISSNYDICLKYPETDARNLYLDSAGRIWTHSSTKLFYWMDNKWTEINLADSLKYTFEIWNLMVRSKTVWAIFMNAKKGQVEHFYDRPALIISNDVKFAIINQKGIYKIMDNEPFMKKSGEIYPTDAIDYVLWMKTDSVYVYNDFFWEPTIKFDFEDYKTVKWQIINDNNGKLWYLVSNKQGKNFIASFEIASSEKKIYFLDDTSGIMDIAATKEGFVIAETPQNYYLKNFKDSSWTKISKESLGLDSTYSYFIRPFTVEDSVFIFALFDLINYTKSAIVNLKTGKKYFPAQNNFKYEAIDIVEIDKFGRGVFRGTRKRGVSLNQLVDPLIYESDSAWVEILPKLATTNPVIKLAGDGHIYINQWLKWDGTEFKKSYLTTFSGNDLIFKDLGFTKNPGSVVTDFDCINNKIYVLGYYPDKYADTLIPNLTIYDLATNTAFNYDYTNSDLKKYYYTSDSRWNNIPDEIPISIIADINGNIWILTTKNLQKFDEGKITRYEFPTQNDYQLYYNIDYDKNSNEILIKENTNFNYLDKVYTFSISSNKLDSFNIQQAGFKGKLIKYKKLIDNNIWASDSEGYLYRYQGNGKFKSFNLKVNGFENLGFPINDFCIDPLNNFHLATEIGLLTSSDFLLSIQGKFNEKNYTIQNIFPNPAVATTRIALQKEGDITISAVDVLGHSFPLWSGYSSAGDIELDVSTLPTGSYTLLIDYGTKREAVRMIKQ